MRRTPHQEMTMSFRKIASPLNLAAVAAFGVLSVLAATPALADSKTDLENKGYTCVVVATGFWSCTKSGEKEKWCDGTSCDDAPAISGNPGSGGGRGKIVGHLPIVTGALPVRGTQTGNGNVLTGGQTSVFVNGGTFRRLR
jgi:hypothetical protein